MKNIKSASDILKKISPSFKDRLLGFSDSVSNYLALNLKGFSDGDSMDKDQKDKLFDFLRRKWRSSFVGRERSSNEVKDLLNTLIVPLGIKYGISKNDTFNLRYDGHEKEVKERLNGKVDKEPLNSGSFFPYDIHEIFNMIEDKLKCKLSDEDRTNIHAIVELETRDIRNKTNMSHGNSDINILISDIEKYINSKKRADASAPTFKFSEFNRYKLKNILSKFVTRVSNAKSKENKEYKKISGSELMQKLQHLKL